MTYYHRNNREGNQDVVLAPPTNSSVVFEYDIKTSDNTIERISYSGQQLGQGSWAKHYFDTLRFGWADL